jgi:hypothetical protein
MGFGKFVLILYENLGGCAENGREKGPSGTPVPTNTAEIIGAP